MKGREDIFNVWLVKPAGNYKGKTAEQLAKLGRRGDARAAAELDKRMGMMKRNWWERLLALFRR